MDLSTCPDCGGIVAYEVSSTRWLPYRGRLELIPCLPIKTCAQCGKEQLTAEEMLQLSDIIDEPRFCEVCACDFCLRGGPTTSFRVRTSDGRWWCDVCYLFDAEDQHSPLNPRPPWVQIETKENWLKRCR